MSVPRLTATVVIDHHGVPVTVLNARERDNAVGRRLDVVAVRDGDIDALMKLCFAAQRVQSPSKLAADRSGGRDVAQEQRR